MLNYGMLYIAITPTWVYLLLICLSVWRLTHVWGRLNNASFIPTALYYTALAQVLLGVIPLSLTAQGPISKAACKVGLWGADFQLALMAGAAILLTYMCIRGPHGFINTFKGYRSFILAVLLSQALAYAMFLRSALLCTV